MRRADGPLALRARDRAGHLWRCLTALLFLVVPDGLYDWIKAGHVIAVIAWMAGMLYLPRLFVYHADRRLGSPQSETFKIMERRLLRAIMNPAMVVAWAFGLWLAWKGFRSPAAGCTPSWRRCC